jgi:hypothetical protein
MGPGRVHRQYFDLPPQWFPTAWDFSVTGAGQTLKFETLQAVRGAAATPAQGLDLDVVWVGLGNEADFAGRDVRGKLAVIKSYPTPSTSVTRRGGTARYNAPPTRARRRC